MTRCSPERPLRRRAMSWERTRAAHESRVRRVLLDSLGCPGYDRSDRAHRGCCGLSPRSLRLLLAADFILSRICRLRRGIGGLYRLRGAGVQNRCGSAFQFERVIPIRSFSRSGNRMAHLRSAANPPADSGPGRDGGHDDHATSGCRQHQEHLRRSLHLRGKEPRPTDSPR